MKEKKVEEINLEEILPNRFQPRISFDETAITELADSIKEHGVIQPIIVRPIGNKYEIIAGERRYKATSMTDLTTIPAIVVDLNDKESAEVALLENIQRLDLTPIEEAVSYKKILDMGYLTQEQLASRIGKNQSTVANKLRLLNLEEEVQEALLDKKISERHARSLLRIKDRAQQIEILKRVIFERMTVRKLDETIDKLIENNGSLIGEENKTNLEKTDNYQDVDYSKYNIPNTTIIGDTPPAVVISSDELIKQVDKRNTNNPGFMDIERIKEEAQDINMNIDENKKDYLQPGKFFNMFDEQPVNNNMTAESSVQGTTEIDTRSIQSPIYEEPIVPVQPMISETNYEPVQPAPMQQPAYEEATPIYEEPIVPVQPMASETNYEAFQPAPMQPSTYEESTPIYEEPIAPVQSMISETNYEAFQPAPMQPSTYKETTPESINESQEVGIIQESPTIREVVRIIRESSQKIENLGYNIDTEEIDFEDMYQVIFKIDKK